MLIAYSSQDIVATLFVAFPPLHVDPAVADGLLFEFCLFVLPIKNYGMEGAVLFPGRPSGFKYRTLSVAYFQLLDCLNLHIC
jgi:hypothetical protein